MTVGTSAPGARPGAGHRVFEVLTVCTANLCRSPAVEALLRADLALLPGSWTVGSAGVEARGGMPVHPDTARVLAERDLSLPAAWRSRRVTAADVERADLVLAATRAHRGALIALVPTASQRVYTLRQFARLVAAVAGRAPEVGDAHVGDLLLRAAISARGLAVPERPEDDDLPDPIGRPVKAFREMADTAAAASTAITSSLLIPR